MTLNKEVTVSVKFNPDPKKLGEWLANSDAVYQARTLDAMFAEMRKWGVFARDSQVEAFVSEMKEQYFLETLYYFGIKYFQGRNEPSEYDAMPRTDEEVDD